MLRTRFLWLLGLVFIIPSCNKEQWFCRDCIHYDHNGTERQYLIHVPDDLPENAPLLFAMHGYTGYAKHVNAALNLNEIADEHGFVVCYPQGSLDDTRTPHWNARLDLSTSDDIGFLSALAITLQGQYGLDTERTYASGISNGGFMSYTLVSEAPQVFKAAVSVVGTMSGYTWQHRDIIAPTSILQITGTSDNIVPMDGSMGIDGGWGGAPHMDTIISFWSDLNACGSLDTVFVSNITTAFKYVDCDDDNQVWYYKVDGMGHQVPNGGNKGFKSGELIWEFLSQL